MRLFDARILSWGCLYVCAAGCGGGGGESGAVPWANQRTQVIDTQGAVQDVAPPTGSDCLQYSDSSADVCVRPQDQCGTQAADVIVDAMGKLLDVVCYPADKQLTVEQIQAANGDVKQTQNGSVILLDGAKDGVDLKGDVAVDANDVVIYGQGPDVSVIQGQLTLDGNNTIVRGVRIKGDVHVVKNDNVFSMCVIEGDLTIDANNTRMIDCDVFGKVTVNGNNTELLGNRFAHPIVDDGKGLTCKDDLSIVDQDMDFTVSAAELAAAQPLACGDAGSSSSGTGGSSSGNGGSHGKP